MLSADGREVRRTSADGLLGDRPLAAVLDTTSWQTLRAAIADAPCWGVELFTHDGRILDATVVGVHDGTAVVLRDVSRYAEAAEQLAAMTVELGRRTRDLVTLYEATTELGSTLDVGELSQATCRIVAGYLDAHAVQLEIHGERSSWPDGTPPAAPSEALELRTARGPLGTVRWWRPHPLTAAEERTVRLLVARSAIGLDHALLLAAAERRAERDPLTGLLNRSGAYRVLAGFTRPHAVALVDLDHFKRINDLHGHAVGDQVLCSVARILSRGRAVDVKARWGGEEFLVALERAGVDETVRWLRERLREVRTTVRAAGEAVSFSAGVALVGRQGLDAALAQADAILYEVKRSGRNAVRGEIDPSERDAVRREASDAHGEVSSPDRI